MRDQEAKKGGAQKNPSSYRAKDPVHGHPPSGHAEVQLIGAFLQLLFDIGEIWDDVEPMRLVQWAHDVGVSLRDVETAGFCVYARRVTRMQSWPEEVPGVGGKQLPIGIATVVVLRNTNARIMNRGTEQEMVGVVIAKAV